MTTKSYKYSYTPHRGRWLIFQESSTNKEKIADAYTKDDARCMVWYLNGWGLPKGVTPERMEKAVQKLEQQIKENKPHFQINLS